jgi:hypothetical protein
MVRIHPDPPSGRRICCMPGRVRRVRGWTRGCSSVGRAPALQAGGHRFDPVHLHHCPVLGRTCGRSDNKPARVQASALAGVLMRDSSGSRRLIFKNTEETRRSLPGLWRWARCAGGIGSAGTAAVAMSIWVMDCVFARPEHRLREEAQAYEKWQLVALVFGVQSYDECGVIGSSD